MEFFHYRFWHTIESWEAACAELSPLLVVESPVDSEVEAFMGNTSFLDDIATIYMVANVQQLLKKHHELSLKLDAVLWRAKCSRSRGKEQMIARVPKRHRFSSCSQADVCP